MKSANPYLYFAGNTREAFDFYRSVFGGDFIAALTYREMQDDSMGISEAEMDRIAHIALPLGDGGMLMGTDIVTGMGEGLRAGNNFQIAIEPESAEEAEQLFTSLSNGGSVTMPLSRTSWAEKHGSCTDRFGIMWLVDYTGDMASEQAVG